MTALHPDFLRLPLAHRGLHDRAAGRPENSRAAFRAAIEAGYGIELDLQLSADGRAMVFHDYDLGRLTGRKGPLRRHDAAALATIPLTGGDEGIPSFREVLGLVAGRVPLLVEIKDQDGAMGPDVGPLEAAAAADLAGYAGPLAVMSFNAHSIAAFTRHAPGIAVGLTTCGWLPKDWPTVPAGVCAAQRAIPDFERVGAGFISHDKGDLANPRVAELKARGAAVLCWTIRSPAEEAAARQVAQNITFERYRAAIPAA